MFHHKSIFASQFLREESWQEFQGLLSSKRASLDTNTEAWEHACSDEMVNRTCVISLRSIRTPVNVFSIKFRFFFLSLRASNRLVTPCTGNSVEDPDLRRRLRGRVFGHPDPEKGEGGGGGLIFFFSALRASVWSNNRGERLLPLICQWSLCKILINRYYASPTPLVSTSTFPGGFLSSFLLCGTKCMSVLALRGKKPYKELYLLLKGNLRKYFHPIISKVDSVYTFYLQLHLDKAFYRCCLCG